MDATCKIQDGIHMPRIIKKCVQDSGYISFTDGSCLYYFTQITYNKLRKLISKKLDIETTIAYN